MVLGRTSPSWHWVKHLKHLEGESSFKGCSGINDSFVQNPASTWESESHFNAGLTTVDVLAVVNDSAVRAITFIEKLNTALTTKEEHTHSNC